MNNGMRYGMVWALAPRHYNDSLDERLTPSVRSVLSVRGSLDARSTFGGTAPSRVATQLSDLADAAHAHAAWASGHE